MKRTSLLVRILVMSVVVAVMIFAGLTGAKPASVNAAAPVSTDEPPLPPVTGSSPDMGKQVPPPPPVVVEPPWDGDPASPKYDGRIGATMADRYAVYCQAGELQVWDGAENRKVAGIPLNRVATMRSHSTLVIGEGVHLGRSDDVLTVVGPDDFVKNGINFLECAGSTRR